VCARRPERAARLATRPEHVLGFEELPLLLERAGLVICATGARTPLLTEPALRSASHARAGWPPLTIVDLSLPRNVDPAARQVAGVRLFDLDDLVEHSTEAQLQRRETIVSDELRRHRSWLAGHAAAPLLAQLHESVHALCRAVVAPWAATTGVEGAAVERAAHRVAGQLLHHPTVTVKELIARGDEPAALRVLAAYGVTPGPTSRRHVAPSIMQEAR
jgi:glutamyl-tRNA reductase